MVNKAWSVFVVAIYFASAGTALATQTSPLGYAMNRLRPFVTTRALVIAKAIEIRRGPTEAYVAFEVVRVERGELAERYLFFPYPKARTATFEPDPGDIKSLQEGKYFLLQIAKDEIPLRHVTLLAGPDDRTPIDKTLKAYAEVDRLRSNDFWQDVNSADINVRAAAFLRALADSDANRQSLLIQYAGKPEPTEFESELATDLIQDPHAAIDNSVLLKIAERPIKAKNDLRSFRQTQARDQAIFRGGMAGGEEWDRAIVQALDEEFVMSGGPILRQRRVADSMPRLRAMVEQALAPPRNQRLAAIAASMLAYQEGPPALDLVRKVIQNNTDEYNLLWLQGAALSCGGDNAITLSKQMVPPDKRYGHNHAFASLVSFGDPEAIGVLLRESTTGNHIRPPHPKELPNRDALKYWQPIARNMLQQDVLADGGAFLNAAEILYWLHDEQLPDLLVGQLGHKYWGEYALQYLALTAQPRHRPALEQFREDPDAIKRSYALAALARLRDPSAMHDVCAMAFLGPDSYARHMVTGNVLARIDRGDLIRAWESDAPAGDDIVAAAKHRYVLSKLSGPLRQIYSEVDPDDIRWQDQPKSHRWRTVTIVAVVAVLIVLCAVAARLRRWRKSGSAAAGNPGA